VEVRRFAERSGDAHIASVRVDFSAAGRVATTNEAVADATQVRDSARYPGGVMMNVRKESASTGVACR
jgi:hypothetical protein